MAVIQISKIQVRRGQKLSGIGVPQLSSAEFAWAVDTQELFIGNGSIAEGAPAVGNTKILTEHDNIFELLAGYRFGNNKGLVYSLERPIQNKLDEYVSLADFGGIGDGSTDCTEAFTNAVNELFRSEDAKLKKTLIIPNGNYVFSANLFIPSTAKIRGETRDGAVLNLGNRNIFFITEDGSTISTPFTSTNRPNNIEISNLTISVTGGQVDISGLANSVIDNVKFNSDYVLGDPIVSFENEAAAVTWENTLPGTVVTEVTFKNCLFESVAMGLRVNQIIIDSSDPARYDTYLDILDCKFLNCDTAIAINGSLSQGNKWTIQNCQFEEVARYAFRSEIGVGTSIRNCKFINCGNTTNEALATHPFIYFGEKLGNAVIDISDNRQQNYVSRFFNGDLDPNTTSYISEVSNSSRTSLSDQVYRFIDLSNSFLPIATFSAENRFTVIDYSLSLGLVNEEHIRKGKITIAVDGSKNDLTFTDEFTYSSPLVSSPGGLVMTNFQFNVVLKDSDLDSGLETILLSYKNPSATGATGYISYSVSYGV